jgi:MFS family permease
MWQYQWVGTLPGGSHPDARPLTQVWSALGAAAGCLVAAPLAGRFGRRVTYAALCVASGLTIFGFYQWNAAYNDAFLVSAGVMGFVAASFYGWLPLYLPELFPTAVRATGQGFGFNSGRILAAVGNLLMPSLLAAFGNDYARACAVVPLVYVAGLLLIAVAPETKGRPLPD